MARTETIPCPPGCEEQHAHIHVPIPIEIARAAAEATCLSLAKAALAAASMNARGTPRYTELVDLERRVMGAFSRASVLTQAMLGNPIDIAAVTAEEANDAPTG